MHTPLKLAQISIINGPKFLDRMNRFGDFQRGHQADLVILNDNPLADIHATQNIFSVATRGKLLDRAKLDSLLVETRKQAMGN